MSPLRFRANSLKMHPCFAGNGYEFLRERLDSAFQSVPISESGDRTELRFLLKQPAATLRSNLPAHITTSSVVLSPEANRVLLVFHRKIAEWVYPGGHADGDWFLLRSALRECFEETGLEEVDVLSPLDMHDSPFAEHCPHLFQKFDIKAVGSEPAHSHYDAVFVFQALSDLNAVFDPSESSAIKWMNIQELEHHAERKSRVVDGMDSLTAQICLRAMQSALGEKNSEGTRLNRLS